MKKLIFATALAALLASPAFAQSWSAGYGTGNSIDLPALEHGGRADVTGAIGNAFAYSPARVRHTRAMSARAEAVGDPDAVYEAGQYIGRDPDPDVRLNLRRDWTHD